MATQVDATTGAPPFDQGMFLLQYNKGREFFQDQNFEGARKELEGALRLRPSDGDVLNLLGLVYFKGNHHEEAERIYRRLLTTNPDVFILHSNLGLVLFKQGNFDEAETELLRAIELKPNYTKSHLYLGLLYKQKGKLGLSLEHLQFAGATKAAREVEEALRKVHLGAPPTPSPALPIQRAMPSVVAPPASPAPSPVQARDTSRAAASSARPASPPSPAPDFDAAKTGPVSKALIAAHAPMPGPARPAIPGGKGESVTETDTAVFRFGGRQGEEKLGHAPLLDSFQRQADDRRTAESVAAPDGAPRTLPLQSAAAKSAESASRTFVLRENGYLEISSSGNVFLKRGTVSTYTGNLKFLSEKNLHGTSAEMVVKVEGKGKLFLYEKGRRTFLIDLLNEFIYVEGHNLLAMEESLSFRKEPIYDYSRNRKIEAIKIYGRGSLAISTAIEPLTLRVTPDYPLNISSESLVAWTGDLIPTVMEDPALADIMTAAPTGFRIRFEGQGVVVAEEA